MRRPIESALAAVVGMQDRGLPIGVSSGDRHPERIDHEFGAHVVADRPTDDSAREHVDNRSAVDFPFPRGVFGDVGTPDLVRALDDEVPVDQVEVGLGLVVTRGQPRRRRRYRPWIPASRINRATSLWLTTMPSPSVSSACTRGQP